jgi:hypothetical protein
MALKAIASALAKRKPKQRQTVKSRDARRRAELEAALNSKETPPATQRLFGRKGVGARSIDEVEDTRIDPETGGSVDTARKVGTRGEKVTLDTRGPRTRGYVEDEAGGRTGAARARRYLALKKLVDDGTATKAERLEFMRMASADADALTRQQGRSIASRQTKSTAAKLSAKQREDARQKFIQDGEITEGFEPTANEIAQAKRNIQRRTRGGNIPEAMYELDAAKTKPRSRSALSGIREEDAGGMNVGGLTRAQKKKQEAIQTYAQKLKAAKRAKQKKKRKSYATDTPTVRRISMSAAKGGLVKTGHTDYRKKGMFYVGGMSAKTTPINKGKKK